MKLKLFFAAVILTSVFVGCKYDDDAIWDKVNSLDQRVTNLETTQAQMNKDISAMSKIVDAINGNIYVTSVETTANGYVIKFSNGTSATIANGKDGTAGVSPRIGDDGNWWIGDTNTGVKAAGKDGINGSNGLTPRIGSDGNWWIGDTNTGVKAAGKDGAAGVTPRIGDDGNWWIGNTNTGVKAAGSDGAAGITPRIGDDGNWWIGDTNTGVKAAGKDGATGITPRIGEDGNWWIGDTNTGVKAAGSDGAAGAAGQTPRIGEDGNWWIGNTNTGVKAAGEDAVADNVPIIGVQEVDGIYYWTLTTGTTTEFLTDNRGRMLPVTGYYAVTPIIKVNTEGYWVISYDRGITYELILDDNNNPVKANGGSTSTTDSFFRSVQVSGNYLILTLKDGTVLTLPINGGGESEAKSDSIFQEVIEFIESLPIENLTLKDVTLANGNNIVDFLETYDDTFVQNNPWLQELRSLANSEVKTKNPTTRAANGITGNAGIVNLRNTVIAEMIAGCVHFMNDDQGVATSEEIRNKIADQGQTGLWYKYGGKLWDEYSYGLTRPMDGVNKKCYGLDCSGLVYQGMSRIGYNVPPVSTNSFYNSALWQEALEEYVTKLTKFPDAVKGNLKFESYEYTPAEFLSKIQEGDIIFCFNGGSNQHMGIVTGDKKIAQSNGESRPATADDNYKGGKRGPHLVTAANMAQYWGFTKFGVVRLVSTLNNTHWRLNIKCEGKSTYITSFDIEIKMDESTHGEITIDPVTTIGHDYGGAQCDVYFTGSFNPETQMLKGSVRKTYSTSTRTDGFEVKLTDDNIYDIQEYRIVSNNACTNYLDLENLDNTSGKLSTRKKIVRNTKHSVAEEYDCIDNVIVF